ncbi:unnamed protein product, partial [marine sediment metagenome]
SHLKIHGDIVTTITHFLYQFWRNYFSEDISTVT